jgi:hypothetical protein
MPSHWHVLLPMPLPTIVGGDGPDLNAGKPVDVSLFDILWFQVQGTYTSVALQIQGALDKDLSSWSPLAYDINTVSFDLVGNGLITTNGVLPKWARVYASAYTPGVDPSFAVTMMGRRTS